MTASDISRIPSKTLPSKSAVAIYRPPGGGGFLWAVATSPDKLPLAPSPPRRGFVSTVRYGQSADPFLADDKTTCSIATAVC